MSCGLPLDQTMPPRLIAGSDAATVRLCFRGLSIAGAGVKPFLPASAFPSIASAIPCIRPRLHRQSAAASTGRGCPRGQISIDHSCCPRSRSSGAFRRRPGRENLRAFMRPPSETLHDCCHGLHFTTQPLPLQLRNYLNEAWTCSGVTGQNVDDAEFGRGPAIAPNLTAHVRFS